MALRTIEKGRGDADANDNRGSLFRFVKISVGCRRFIAHFETFFLLLMRFKSFGTGDMDVYRLIFVRRGRIVTLRNVKRGGNGINEDDTRQGNPNHIGWPAYRRNFIPILSSPLLLPRKALSSSLLRRCLTSCVKRGSSGVYELIHWNERATWTREPG